MIEPFLHKLPSGESIYTLSSAQADFLYAETIDSDPYFRHGVTVNDGDCLFDIGANIGFFLLSLSGKVSHARVFCFEPIGSIFATLEKNAALFPQLEVELKNYGLASNDGELEFVFYPESSANSTMFPEKQQEIETKYQQGVNAVLEGRTKMKLKVFERILLKIVGPKLRNLYAKKFTAKALKPEQVRCQLKRMSDVISEHELEAIDLLKVDAEYAEFEILGGLDKNDWSKVRQIVLEFHEGESELPRMLELIHGQGFQTVVEPEENDSGNFMIYATRPEA